MALDEKLVGILHDVVWAFNRVFVKDHLFKVLLVKTTIVCHGSQKILAPNLGYFINVFIYF
jgi:hypothetical protein